MAEKHHSLLLLTTLKFEILIHPAYNPDLCPSNYEVFGALKKFLACEHFSIDEEVKKVIREWMLQVGMEY